MVVGYTKHATRALQRRILQAPRRFVQYFYAFSRGFPQVLLRAADSDDARTQQNAYTYASACELRSIFARLY
ncbi:acyltransferase family protein [Burkholderia multivorans ATCC 17616]|nr:acyltransferase family protein [Burkholderia multivorans ATCC 17616]